MSKQSHNERITPDRRQLLGAVAMSAVAAGVSNFLPLQSASAAADATIRPFRVNVPEHELVDLRRRLAATKWPEKEIVDDQSQGVQLATAQQLVRHWQDYDWRKVEARLNALPQFITRIDGVDIHFIHLRSKHENALPLIVTHGWPGSIIEQLKIVDPLTNPTAHGANASDAFDLVIPSLPGHGFSGKPTELGWDPIRIARAWVVLMKRPWIHAIRRARRRLGQCGDRADGAFGAAGIDWHSHQHARHRPRRRRKGTPRRTAGVRPLGRRETCL
jgi:Epoxide hydrolase N terminus